MDHPLLVHQAQGGIDPQHPAVGVEGVEVLPGAALGLVDLAQQGKLLQPPVEEVVDGPGFGLGYGGEQGVDPGADHQHGHRKAEADQHHHGRKNHGPHIFQDFVRQLLHPGFSFFRRFFYHIIFPAGFDPGVLRKTARLQNIEQPAVFLKMPKSSFVI